MTQLVHTMMSGITLFQRIVTLHYESNEGILRNSMVGSVLLAQRSVLRKNIEMTHV